MFVVQASACLEDSLKAALQTDALQTQHYKQDKRAHYSMTDILQRLKRERRAALVFSIVFFALAALVRLVARALFGGLGG